MGTGSSARSNFWREAAEICNYKGIGWRLSPIRGSLALNENMARTGSRYPLDRLSLKSRLSLVSLIACIPAAGRGVPEDKGRIGRKGSKGWKGFKGMRIKSGSGLNVEAIFLRKGYKR